MVKYTLEAINALLNPIPRIEGRPTFSSLWNLAQDFYSALRKLDHPDHPNDGYSGCLMAKEEYALRSTKEWKDPEAVEKFFVMPTTAITSGDQEQAKGEFKYKRDLLDSYEQIVMALKAAFERVIDKAYHTTGNTGIMGEGFGQMRPYEILKKMRELYGRPTIQEIESKLLQLSTPMDRNLPVEVMIKDVEDVQRFLLANPADKMEMTDVQLCTHGLIKLSKTGGLYTKAVERWNQKDLILRQQWTAFKTHFIEEYEKLLAAGAGTTMAQEGYGRQSAYKMVEEETSSLAESIVQYAERATTAESRVSELESRLSALEMSVPQQAAYFMPQMTQNAQAQTAPPTSITVPPPYWQQSQQQGGGKRDYASGENRGYTRRKRANGGGRGGGRNSGNTQRAYSNTVKQHLNLLYCFSCGYDVDHDGYNCPPRCQKKFHLPHVKRDEAHTYEGACMKAQHKTLPDGTGAGLGWIMTKNMEKGRFVLDKQAQWRQQQQGQRQNTQNSWPQQQQQQWQPRQQANNVWQQQPQSGGMQQGGQQGMQWNGQPQGMVPQQQMGQMDQQLQGYQQQPWGQGNGM